MFPNNAILSQLYKSRPTNIPCNAVVSTTKVVLKTPRKIARCSYRCKKLQTSLWKLNQEFLDICSP